MKRVSLFLLFTFLLAFSTLTFADEKPLSKPDVLSEETILTSQHLSGYDTIVIKDFATDGAEYSQVNDEEKAKIETMKPLLVRTISESLEMELKNRKLFKNIVKNGDMKENAVILEGSFTEFNAGSRALKLFVGFGAGKVFIKVKGRLIDARTGKELALFEDRETGYRGSMTLEGFEDLFPHQAKGVGENLANFIQKLY